MIEYENYLEYKTLGKLPEDVLKNFQKNKVHIEPVRIPDPRKNADVRWDAEKKELWVGESHTKITWDMIQPYMDVMEKLYVPKTVREIDVNALNECTCLWAVCINVSNPYFETHDGYDLYKKENDGAYWLKPERLIWSIIGRKLPEKEAEYSKGYVTNVPSGNWPTVYVSEECTHLTRELLQPYMKDVYSIQLQKNVRSIDWAAIDECPKLRSIHIVYKNPYYKERFPNGIYERGSNELVWPKKK